MTESLFESLPCGCKATACDTGWRIEAKAFLCAQGHKQGDAVPRINFDMVEENAQHIRNALRKLDPLDDDVRAAGEALGALIYLARKERS